MATVTIDIPDELSAQLASMEERLPELLALSLYQPAIPAAFYRTLVDFLARQPTPAEVMAFRPSPAMHARLATLLERSAKQQLAAYEHAELAEFERIEHVVILLKAGSLSYLVATP